MPVQSAEQPSFGSLLPSSQASPLLRCRIPSPQPPLSGSPVSPAAPSCPPSPIVGSITDEPPLLVAPEPPEALAAPDPLGVESGPLPVLQCAAPRASANSAKERPNQSFVT